MQHGLLSCVGVGRAAAWQRVPPAVSHQPALLHAEKVFAADDNVVEYVDA